MVSNTVDTRIETSGHILERTAKKLKRSFQRWLKAESSELTADQWVILDILAKSSGLSQYHIAQQTAKDAPTVTRIIDILCEKQLIAREIHPDDRRKFKVIITKEGLQKHRELLPGVQQFRQGIWGDLTPQDLTELKRILHLIDKNFD